MEQLVKTANVLLMLALATAAAGESVAAPLYRATDLGFAGKEKETTIFDMNDKGVAVGASSRNSIIWSKERGLQIISEPDEPVILGGRCINNDNEIAGFVVPDVYTRKAVLAKPDRSHLLFLKGTWANAKLDPVMPISDINDAGAILGKSGRHPWIWSESQGLRALPIGETDFGSYSVNRMNESEQVAGQRSDSSSTCFVQLRGFVYDTAAQQFLPIDGGPDDIQAPWCGYISEATAINNLGQAVGYIDDGTVRPIVWSRETGSKVLPGSDVPLWRELVPRDINDAGQVIGTFFFGQGGLNPIPRFFYWDRESGAVDLQTLLDPSAPFSAQIELMGNGLQSDGFLHRINNRGQIVVSGKLKGNGGRPGREANRAFVLTPVEP